jgi:hypothetical protein
MSSFGEKAHEGTSEHSVLEHQQQELDLPEARS